MTTKSVGERLALLENDNQSLRAQARELLHQIDRLRTFKKGKSRDFGFLSGYSKNRSAV